MYLDNVSSIYWAWLRNADKMIKRIDKVRGQFRARSPETTGPLPIENCIDAPTVRMGRFEESDGNRNKTMSVGREKKMDEFNETGSCNIR